MRKSAALIIVLTAVAFFLTCSDNPTNSVSDSLTGTWTWTKSIGGNLAYLDPETCQCTQRFIFNTDNSYENYYNDVLVEDGIYKITDIQEDNDGRYIIMFTLNGDEAKAALRQNELIMLPSPLCLACPDSVYYEK